ncbi:MAG: ATP-binding protein [Casimicrobiaceae bacterium]
MRSESDVQPEDEERQLRSVAIQNAKSILLASQRGEEELVRAKEALERRTEELAHSLAMMRATLESTTDGILVTDAAGRMTDCNQKYEQMWGLARPVMDGGDHHRMVRENSRQFADARAFTEKIRTIYANALPETFDVLHLADGRVFELFTKVQLVDGIAVGRVWSFRDITERRRTEDALRDETRVLELLNVTGTTLTSKLELQDLVQAVTDAATALSGAKFGAFFYSVKDADEEAMLCALSGTPLHEFAQVENPRSAKLLGPTLRGEGPLRCDDVLQDPRSGWTATDLGTPAGQPPTRSYLAVPVVSRTGRVMGGLFFGHPVPGIFTERSERLIVGVAAQAAVAIDNARLYEASRAAAEEREQLLASERAARSEAERMSQMKDAFLASLSHELRTPLSAILGWTHILSRGTKSEADLERGIATIERNARMQARLIEDLLDMSRITSGKLRLDIQPVDPATFVESAVETMRPAAEAKGIRLDKILDPTAGPVSGDPNRLQQIVWNLLSNAIKFTPKGGRVQVLLARVDSHVEISVADTGAGIKAEFLPHVFDRFRQADASTTRSYGGLGLGLAIVKQLVEMHGGTVGAASPGENAGATFSVRLPLAAVRRTELNAPRVHPGTPTLQGRAFPAVDLSGVRVLVVDDEPDGRELVKRVLDACGAEVLTAGTATEALAVLQRSHPHVLVSDIGMPDVDGFELLQRIRALGPEQGGLVPAIALTAFARAEDRTQALHAGFAVHVSKPVEASELIATVASVAGRAGGRR